MYKKYIKRILDVISSLLLFIVISPLFVLIIIITRCSIGSPVFFCQERTGLNFNRFRILKFRTMSSEKDELGNLLPDEKRLTKWGKILRMTSLDELPELLSIIKGDMSVVGPRPLPSDYDAFYRENEKKTV